MLASNAEDTLLQSFYAARAGCNQLLHIRPEGGNPVVLRRLQCLSDGEAIHFNLGTMMLRALVLPRLPVISGTALLLQQESA